MVLNEPPYPLPPRHVPTELGRWPLSTATTGVHLAVVLLALSGYWLFPWFAFAAAVAFLFDVTDSPIILRTLGFIVFTVFGTVGLKGWLARRQRPPLTNRRLDDQPLASAFVQKVLDDLGATQVPLHLTSGTTLKLDAFVSPWRLLRGPQWELHVGLWLWYAVNLSEFKALLLRTLAPLHRSRVQRWHFRAVLLLEGYLNGIDALDALAATTERGSGFARMVRGSYRGLTFPVRLLALLCRWCVRVPEQELANDGVAVRLAGSDSLVHALFHTDHADLFLSKWNDELVACRREGIRTRDLYAHRGDAERRTRNAAQDDMLGVLPAQRGLQAGKYVDVFEPNQAYRGECWEHFPSPGVREEAAKRTFVIVEADERPATMLLLNLPALCEQLTQAHYEAILHAEPTLLPLPPSTVRRWLAMSPDTEFLPRYGGLYDAGRLLEPGSRNEREAALLSHTWDDTALANGVATLYTRVAPVVQRWQEARKKLRKLLRKTLYRPGRRYRDDVQDLDDERIKTGKWLAAIDQRAFVLYVHMAARLHDHALHDDLIQRYRSILRFQVFVADAREFCDRTAAYVHHGEPSSTFRRELRRSREDFENLLADAREHHDALLLAFTDGVPLERFLYAHEGGLPMRLDRAGRRLLHAWEEVVGKVDWLHNLGIRALLQLHEQIAHAFAEQTALTLTTVTPDEPDVLED